jgi:hypothetical protein
MGASSQKKKATAKEHARQKASNRRDPDGRASVPASENQRSQSRFPGERSLTGEDRPARRSGGKTRGESKGDGGGRRTGAATRTTGAARGRAR